MDLDKLKNDVRRRKELKTLLGELSKFKEYFEEIKTAITEKKDPVDTVEVSNFPKQKDSVKVENLGDIKIPESVTVKNLKELQIPEPPKTVGIKKPKWFSLKSVTDGIDNIVKAIKQKELPSFDKYKLKKNALAVRLVDRDGNEYYTAGGSGGGNLGSGNSILSKEEKQDTIIENQEILTKRFTDSSNIDAFGRFRVSTPYTIFDSKAVWDDEDLANTVENQPLLYDNQQVSGTGTSTEYRPNESSTTLTVSANTAGKRVRQTKRRFNYQPGKSQLYFNTLVMGEIVSGITKREGFFDEQNGLFLELSDDVYAVSRSYTSGTAVDTKIAQANWNLDPMDGTGQSGITLDLTKTNILAIDFEWLGVGRVRFGFVINGQIIYVHEFLNANNLTVVYSSTPNMPIRTEIENDGTGVEDSITQICSTVISEGGQEDTGIIRYASTNGTHLDATTENTIYAVIGIRLKTQSLCQTVKLLSKAIQIQTASDRCEWMLLFNPTVDGTFTYTGESQSVVEIARGATANTVTGGYKIDGGFVESGGNAAGAAGSVASGLSNALILGSDIDGTRDEIVLAIRPIGGSSGVDVEGSITWRELS